MWGILDLVGDYLVFWARNVSFDRLAVATENQWKLPDENDQ